MIFAGYELTEFGAGYTFGIDIHFLNEHARQEAYTDRFFIIQINFWSYQLELFLEYKKPAKIGVNADE